MDTSLDFPFASRYGSAEMRAIWSDANRRALWRRIWVALAQAQAQAGLVTPEQVADLEAHAGRPNTKRALEIEQEIGHDVMAEVRAFAEQCPVGGGIIHWGATSADITDNADVLRQAQSLALLRQKLAELLRAFAGQITAHRALVCMAYTHIQPAEPTTLGYRLAMYAQDLLEHLKAFDRLVAELRGKGLKGAVGTAASYQELLAETGASPAELEAHVMKALGLPAFLIATQTYPRIQDYRVLAALPGVAWDNAAESLLERTLDDSANRRVMLPEAFLACDEILMTAAKIVSGLVVDSAACAANLEKYGPFAATERVLMALVRAGADRQHMHERLREHSLKAWKAVKAGRPNSLAEGIASDADLLHYLQPVRLRELMKAEHYVGTAMERAEALVVEIRRAVD